MWRTKESSWLASLSAASKGDKMIFEMPLLTLFQLEVEGGRAEEVGPLSYENGDSFFSFRQFLDTLNMFEFAYDFWDPRCGKRMLKLLEKGNKIEDHDGKVIIIPVKNSNSKTTALADSVLLQHNGLHHGVVGSVGTIPAANLPSISTFVGTEDRVGMEPSLAIHLSSGASNSMSEWQPTFTVSGGTGSQNTGTRVVSPTVPSLTDEPEIVGSPIDNGTDERGDVCVREDFKSKLMSVDLVKHLRKSILNCEIYMGGINRSEHKWKVRTWDEDAESKAELICLECDTTKSCATKGFLDKISVNSCFINFKHKHVTTDKHGDNFCLKRKLSIAKHQMHAKARSAVLSERALVDIGIQIMQNVNEDESVKEKPFILIGDLDKEPCYSFYYKVKCTYYGDLMCLVPRQRNLEHNLREHLVGKDHIAAVKNAGQKGSLLTGRPGRPTKVDRRDTKQRSIHKFFGHDKGKKDESSSGKGMEDVNLSLSLLCWGLWRDTISSNGFSRSVKSLLDDQLRGKLWWGEPHVSTDVYNNTSGVVESISGLFRHESCSRVSTLGGGFTDLTCEACHTISVQTDFRLRILREEQAPVKRGTRDTSQGTRLDYLSNSELRSQARGYSRNFRSEKVKSKRYLARICMLQTKIPSLREMVGEAANRKDIFRFCSTITNAHQKGLFGGKTAVWDLLKDIVFNLNRRKGGKRYSKGTKVICQALLQHGGRRVIECLSMNMISPSLNTLQRDRRGMVYFKPGFHVEQFQLVARVLSKAKERLGIVGDIPCILAEDETAVKTSIRWFAKTDTLVGFCGPKVQHRCVSGQEIPVGEGEQGFETIMSSFSDQLIGSYARVFIVNPLHEDMPRMCIFATTTCNSFRSPWVREQWDQAEEMWAVYCRAEVGPLIGHSSDGDPRRRKLMLEDFRGEGVILSRQSLGWAGWRLTHSWLKNGDAYGLHDSDFMHDLKKGVGPMDSHNRVLHCGNGVITLEHLELMYQLHSVSEHGLNRDDLARTDRQNWASAQRLCGRKVLKCLQAVRERNDARVEKTLATELYLTILGDYLDIFLNERLSLRQRIVLCGKVSFYFRLWRLWLKKGNKHVGGNRQLLTMDNMISLEAFHDFQLSCHFVVYLIVLFRDKYSNLPVPLHLTGSDVCEQFFSKVGGMRGHERNYDFAELVQAASSLNRLAELEMYEGIVSVGKSHKKYKNVWMKMHPLLEGETKADLSDYSEVSTNALVVEALKDGLQEARNICIRLEMCPSTSASLSVRKWWDEPWLMEVQLGWEDEVVGLAEREGDNEEVIDTTLQENENIEVEGCSDIEIDDGISDLALAEGEFSHALSEMFVNVEEGPFGGLEQTSVSQIVPTVHFEGKSIYKSTLVSQLVGNPRLSKDRLIKVRQSIYFNNLVDKPCDREGAPSMPMWIGSDIGVFFLEPIEKGKTRSATKKKKKSSKATCSSTIVPVERATERSTWYIGRVQKVKKIYGTSTWAKCREPVNLLDRPSAAPGVEGSVCDVLCNWFSSTSTKGKLKYDTTDPQWVNLESVISTVSLRVQPQNPSIFILHPNDMKCLDDFVKAKM